MELLPRALLCIPWLQAHPMSLKPLRIRHIDSVFGVEMTRFVDLPDASRCLWAKSADGLGHGLLAHMLDVAAVALTILRRESPRSQERMAAGLGLPNPGGEYWIALLVGLHDYGKGIPGFQATWPEGRLRDEAAGLPFDAFSLRVTDHACATAALLYDALGTRSGAPPQWVDDVLQAISAHHGFNFGRRDIDSAHPPGEKKAWKQARQAIFEAYWDTLAPPGVPHLEALSLPVVAWLAGLTSVADWIGSNEAFFTPKERGDSLRAHFDEALKLADAALDTIGWPSFAALLDTYESTDTLLGRIVGAAQPLLARPLQVAGDKLLADAHGPALLLVEAPMGEGKTELAMLAHLRLQAANQHRGLYLALPTQATGNAMFDRALRFLRAFAGEMRLDIQLAHGGAMLDERIARLRGIHGQSDDSIASSAWFAQRRRALISPYGVGTIDQALFATLNVKHHFVRLWGLANRVVVLDEVHAYDTYTSGLIEALLCWLKALGCSVVLMSATLPAGRRTELLAAWGVDAAPLEGLSYPRVVLADDSGARGACFGARPLPPIHVSGIEEPLDAIAAKARVLLAEGGCGGVIVNTVARAQALHTLLTGTLPEPCTLILFHARYPADERGGRERQVLDTFGPGGARPARALLIATQVAEQSLDIDLDFLISDLAPIDLLLQRAGRLHRHERARPDAHRQARFWVAGLIKGRFPELEETRWKYVYDPYILSRTWALGAIEPEWQLPGDIDRLVQRVYDDNVDLPDDLPTADRKRIEEADYAEFRAKVRLEAQQARNAAIEAHLEPQAAYIGKPHGSEDGNDLGIENRTRLGDEGITVIPLQVVGEAWRIRDGDTPFDPRQPISDTLARALYARQLKISHKAIVASLGPEPPPPAFEEHPLLRDMKPLLLQDGGAVLGNMVVRLDAVLGLVLETAAQEPPPVSDKEE